MSNLSICVLCKDDSETDKTYPTLWFDLYHHTVDSIRQELKDVGADPLLGRTLIKWVS